jgi:sugar phosphate isomerase/epimerase
VVRIGICEWTTFPAAERYGVRVALEPIHPSQAEVLSPVERILGVHVSDRCRPATPSDFDRALPGEDSRPAVRALVAGGYDGWFDVEVMSDDGTFGNAFPDSLWALPVDEIARRAVTSMEALA